MSKRRLLSTGKSRSWARTPGRTSACFVLAISSLIQACSTAGPRSLTLTPGPGELVSIDVTELTVQDIQTAYATGEFTAVELTRAFLDRIDRYEDHYNALISMNPEALAIAAIVSRREQIDLGSLRDENLLLPLVSMEVQKSEDHAVAGYLFGEAG